MPIQFRCPHCNQLMGIARRKTGTVIHCPTCTKPLIVPRSNEAAEEPALHTPARQRPDSLLEKIDVDAILNPPAPGRAAEAVKTEKLKPVAAGGKPPAPPPPHRSPASLDARPAAIANAAPAAAAPANGADPDLPSLALVPNERGIVISRTRLILLAVAGLVLVVLAFVLGLVVGWQM
jgi:hypothetical protein